MRNTFNKLLSKFLRHSARNCHLEIVNALLAKHADVNHIGQHNDTALIWAVKKRLLCNLCIFVLQSY